jgi:hypothetical protein
MNNMQDALDLMATLSYEHDFAKKFQFTNLMLQRTYFI